MNYPAATPPAAISPSLAPSLPPHLPLSIHPFSFRWAAQEVEPVIANPSPGREEGGAGSYALVDKEAEHEPKRVFLWRKSSDQRYESGENLQMQSVGVW